MTRTVFAPHLGRPVRVDGCQVNHLHVRHALAMRHLSIPAKLSVPDETSFASKANLRPLLSEMFLNDQLGDCVIAARARRIGLLTGNATGSPFVYTEAMLDAEYARIGGYQVGDPSTDQGCDPTVSADDGVRVGYADGSKDAGWITVDAANQHEVMVANFITSGACDLSLALPDAWVDELMPKKDGDVWPVAGDPDPRNGHNVPVVDHSAARGVLVVTWGLRVWIQWDALAKYGARASDGMLIAHVNHDAIARTSRLAPSGFDWSTMLTYFHDELGGDTSSTGPADLAPTNGPVTLSQAQALAAAGCHRGPSLMSRGSASRYAEAGLATSWPASR